MDSLFSQLPDSHTVLYGVFGNPIKHSKSPVMMNRAFRETGTNAVYAAFEVKQDQLREAIQGVRALNYRGINVTIPHKVEVMRLLDHVDEDARRIGAVNTIVNEDGRLIGYNTDGLGYVRSLKEETGSLQGKRILVLGAGGAARGVGFALAKEQPAALWIANRTVEKAVSLAKDISPYCETTGIGYDRVADLHSVDLIVNTTSVGMHPHVDATPLDTTFITPNMIVSDLVYNPLTTKLLAAAKSIGATAHSGLGMFIYQGAIAFEHWTGKPAPIAAMREAVEQALKE